MSNLSTRSGVFNTVQAFINHNSNYMRVTYTTEVRLRETLLDYLEPRNRMAEEDLWEVLTDICPAFCDFVSAV